MRETLAVDVLHDRSENWDVMREISPCQARQSQIRTAQLKSNLQNPFYSIPGSSKTRQVHVVERGSVRGRVFVKYSDGSSEAWKHSTSATPLETPTLQQAAAVIETAPRHHSETAPRHQCLHTSPCSRMCLMILLRKGKAAFGEIVATLERMLVRPAFVIVENARVRSQGGTDLVRSCLA